MSIKIVNLTKNFGNLVAVDNVNLNIEDNQIFALLGLNGAGKTTLIKMLSCLIPPTSGDAFIFDKSILKNQQEIKQEINIAPQETSVAQNLTVLENLVFISEVYGLSKSDAIIKSEEMLKTFGLTDKKEVLAKKLSGGLQRRLVFYGCYFHNLNFFLMEPTLGLDIVARKNYGNYNKIKRINNNFNNTLFLKKLFILPIKLQ